MLSSGPTRVHGARAAWMTKTQLGRGGGNPGTPRVQPRSSGWGRGLCPARGARGAPQAAHPPPHTTLRDHVRPGWKRPQPATTCDGPWLGCGSQSTESRNLSRHDRTHPPMLTNARPGTSKGPVPTVQAVGHRSRAAPGPKELSYSPP